jgi:hypothetical protein
MRSKISINRFTNTMQGITANGSNFDEISYNTFNVPLGNENINSWGLNLFNSAGFLATENTFNSSQSNDYTYGLLARNTSLASGQAYKNTFAGKFYAATQAEQNNNRLQIKCNTYSGVNTYDWAITSGMLANQGVCFDESSPAGNIFGVCNNNDASQIWKSPFVPEFAYRSHSDRKPICTENQIFIEDCLNSSDVNLTCQNIVNTIGSNGLNGLITKNNNTPEGPEKDLLKSEIIRILAQEGNKQALIDFISQQGNLPENVMILIPTHIENGDCAQARALLNVFDRSTADKENFFKLYDVLTALCETERGKTEINPIEREIIKNVKESETYVSVNAEALLLELNKKSELRKAERIFVPQGMMTQNTSNLANEKQKIVEKQAILTIYPNPSETGKINISIKNDKNGQIIISDAVGRVYFEKNIIDNNYSDITTDLPKGFYVIKYTDLDGKIETSQIYVK